MALASHCGSCDHGCSDQCSRREIELGHRVSLLDESQRCAALHQRCEPVSTDKRQILLTPLQRRVRWEPTRSTPWRKGRDDRSLSIKALSEDGRARRRLPMVGRPRSIEPSPVLRGHIFRQDTCGYEIRPDLSLVV